jgi:hypothetical protein
MIKVSRVKPNLTTAKREFEFFLMKHIRIYMFREVIAIFGLQ